MSRPLDDLTLREKVRDAAHLTRDLVEHLEQSFQPVAHSLRKLVRHNDEDQTTARATDVGIRNTVQQILERERYTAQIDDKLEALCAAIVSDTRRILNG
jgi:hypothetical protein